MKRWMSLIVLLLLLLCGCGDNDASGTETTVPTDATEPALPLAAYDLSVEGGTDLIPMGDDLLFCGQEELVLLSGQTMKVLSSTEISGVSDLGGSVLRADSDGLIYYDGNSHIIHFLDTLLQPVRQLQLHDEVLGTVLMPEQKEVIYYCTAKGIQVLDISTGVRRTLCHREGNWLGITESFCNDTVLQCRLEDNGQIRTLYFSAGTGEMILETEKITFLGSEGDLYFGSLQTESAQEWIYGWGEDQPRNFWANEGSEIYPLLKGSAAVTVKQSNTGAVLDYFDLKTGKRTASLEETGITGIVDLAWLDGHVFLMDKQRLYRWSPDLTSVDDTQDYMSFRYTREDPDEIGMQHYVDRARELEEFYGINIILWEDVSQVQPENYQFVGEYIPENYASCMDALQEVLSQFSVSFFRKAAEWTESKTLNIVLVRKINTDVKDSHPDTTGLQYLLNTDAYIVLELGEEVEHSFYHMLGHIIDIYVLSNSKKLYEWSGVNPTGFRYENDYTSYASKTNSKYLTGSRKYFINAFSTSFPVEDRATIFEYAITPGNEECFESKYMQVKLRRICDGIRDAFGLKGESYLWEQYLN